MRYLVAKNCVERTVIAQSFSLHHRQRQQWSEGRHKHAQTPHVTAIITHKTSSFSDGGGGGWLGEVETLVKTSIQPSNIDLTLNLHSPWVIPPGRSYTTNRAGECRANGENKDPAGQDLLSSDLHERKNTSPGCEIGCFQTYIQFIVTRWRRKHNVWIM